MTAGGINFPPNCFWDVNPLHSPRGRGFFFFVKMNIEYWTRIYDL